MNSMLDPNTKIDQLIRAGQESVRKLKKLNINTIKNLLYYFPFRYEDYSKISKIQQLMTGNTATVKGLIELIDNRRSPVKRKILTEAIISDDTGSIKAIWFNQPYLLKIYKGGDEVYLSGKVDYDYKHLHFVNPIIEKVKRNTLHTARIVPIYSTTENLTQKQIRYFIQQSLRVVSKISDWLPYQIKHQLKLRNLDWSLKQAHFPDNQDNLNIALRRLKFDELFLLQLKIQLSKIEFLKNRAHAIAFHEEQTKLFVTSLPFTLTDDQKKVAWQVLQDVSQEYPANRLIEGEVGSGKTVVIALAIFNVALSGLQSVFMAPTEILAVQHHQTFVRYFHRYPIKVGLLTRSESRINNRAVLKNTLLKKVKVGEISLLIGTHALIVGKSKGLRTSSKSVDFYKLGLAVVDEQHRFGVEQRQALIENTDKLGISPHFISMTATPIPRTLSLIFYGDLHISKIAQLPQGRKTIITQIVAPEQKVKTYQFIKDQIKNGRQVFVICPLIDPSDTLGIKSVTTEYKRLKDFIFQEYRIDYLHGKLKPKIRFQKMKQFTSGTTDILVSTSVVEVGVDVPNATIMIIEDAHRFGLAQLYQFRGRVGRGKHQSYCFLFSSTQDALSQKRLRAFLQAKDCFELAELDLQLRGPGEIFGVTQSGFQDLYLAKLEDWKLATDAKIEVEKILSQEREIYKYPLLVEKIKNELKLAHLE